MQIALTKEDVHNYARLYSYDVDDKILRERLDDASDRGYIMRDDLIEVARWKWRGGRTRRLVSENTEEEVREISSVSFAAKAERLRIGALLALRGVQWPMASVILHFSFPESYPILDTRAMNTVGGSTSYTYEKWIEYVRLCRDKATDYGVSMRELDQALWAFDIERGKSR